MSNLWRMLSKDFVVLVIIACVIAVPVAYIFHERVAAEVYLSHAGPVVDLRGGDWGCVGDYVADGEFPGGEESGEEFEGGVVSFFEPPSPKITKGHEVYLVSLRDFIKRNPSDGFVFKKRSKGIAAKRYHYCH